MATTNNRRKFWPPITRGVYDGTGLTAKAWRIAGLGVFVRLAPDHWGALRGWRRLPLGRADEFFRTL